MKLVVLNEVSLHSHALPHKEEALKKYASLMSMIANGGPKLKQSLVKSTYFFVREQETKQDSFYCPSRLRK